MPGTYRLTVTQEFCAAHQLRNFGGKCEQLHGHNFGVEVVVEGEKLDDKIDYLVDFGVLKKMTKRVLSALDHKHLNEVPPFDKCNPSSELIAKYIYDEMKTRLAEAAPQVRIVEVSVSEKPQQRATYFEA